MKAIWNGITLAESNDTVVVEGNHYFPPEAVDARYLSDSDHQTHCPWKGDASYKTVTIDGQSLPDGAWYYPQPKEAAAAIRDHFAFWKGVEVRES